LTLLERRLDNVVYKLNFTLSRRNARQLIAHGHIRVNNRKVDIVSFLVKPGDKVTVRDTKKTKELVKANLGSDGSSTVQAWLQLDPTAPEGTILAMPSREDVQIPVEEQLIIEFCSR
ncbi:MAG: 30S ribosomal protein S4, partial [Planctomycetes bacterium]|nr:30S ribosomal protein S4 [Planctomycetota bacterium]